MTASDRVAMTDLAERLLEPGGSREAERLRAHIADLAARNDARLASGTSADEYRRRRILAQALSEAETLMRSIGRWAEPDAPNP